MPDNPIEKLKALEAAADPAVNHEPEPGLVIFGWVLSGNKEVIYPICDQVPPIFEAYGDKAAKNAELVVALRNLAPELIALWNECQRAHLYLDLPPDVEGAFDVLNCKAKEVLE